MIRAKRLAFILLALAGVFCALPATATDTTFERCRDDFGICLDAAQGIQAVQVCQLAFETCRATCEAEPAKPAPPCFVELPAAGIFQRTWHVQPEAITAFALDDDVVLVEVASGLRLRVALDLPTFLERLHTNCGNQPVLEGGPPTTQGFVFDIAQDIVGHLAGDEERIARWVSTILLEASERGYVDISFELANDLGEWIATGVALVTQEDVTLHELTEWVDNGVALIQRHRASLEQ